MRARALWSETNLHQKRRRKFSEIPPLNDMSRLSRGYVQIYTGNGKGKTTAALGQSLRAAGSGLKSFIVQFMKNCPYGEIHSLSFLSDWITIEQYGNEIFVLERKMPADNDIMLAQKALHQAWNVMVSGKYDIITLDEICIALYYNLIKLEEVFHLLSDKPKHVEIILTGRYCPKGLLEKADLVTEMKEIKHYYQKGVSARKGIEL
ncbi:MAG: cob(I)yrinic acid a,c-diamide adenosyltransferase [Syntrophales bacterium]|nr:cob(I)yrinic acid a,c-diamide adenosyltransferase [Syntrophales bacterium]MDD5640564.1 cob(I)yrinic acid a,c-diamide adenosyltransferase [Syntrophales bacterium]